MSSPKAWIQLARLLQMRDGLVVPAGRVKDLWIEFGGETGLGVTLFKPKVAAEEIVVQTLRAQSGLKLQSESRKTLRPPRDSAYNVHNTWQRVVDRWMFDQVYYCCCNAFGHLLQNALAHFGNNHFVGLGGKT